MFNLVRYIKLRLGGKTSEESRWILTDKDIDFERYIKLKKEGKTAVDVYEIADAEGLNILQIHKILWRLYHTSFGDVKEFMVKHKYGCESLSEYQEKYILPALKEALELESREQKSSKEKIE